MVGMRFVGFVHVTVLNAQRAPRCATPSVPFRRAHFAAFGFRSSHFRDAGIRRRDTFVTKCQAVTRASPSGLRNAAGKVKEIKWETRGGRLLATFSLVIVRAPKLKVGEEGLSGMFGFIGRSMAMGWRSSNAKVRGLSCM